MICFIYPRSIALPPLLTHSLIDDEDSILERSSATKDDWARAPHHHPLDKKIVKLKKKRPKTQFWGVCGQYSWIYIDRWLALSLSLSPLLEQSNSSETTNWDTKRYRDRISYAFRFFRFYERLFFEGSLFFDRNRTNDSITTKICNTLQSILYNPLYHNRFFMFMINKNCGELMAVLWLLRIGRFWNRLRLS